MKTRNQAEPTSCDLIMKAIIICDDFAFAAKADAILTRVGRRPDINVQWTLKGWPVSALNQPFMVEKTLLEAADAHLIVIPGRLAHFLPPSLLGWLERWAALRQIPDGAVAVVADDVRAGYTKTVNPELTSFIQKHGLNFITDEGDAAKDASRLRVRFSFERELPLLIKGSRFAHAMAHASVRGLG